MEVIPYYEGNPDYDVLLHNVDDKHGGHETDPVRIHERALHTVVEALWDNPRVRRQLVKQMWDGTKGFTPEYYDVKDTYKDDAMSCYQLHKRPGRHTHLCSDYRNSDKRIGNPAYQDRVKMSRELRDHDLRYSGPKIYLCQFCPYESEVNAMKADKHGDFSEKLN